MKTISKLAQALLNATLMLAVMLVALALLLVSRVSNLAEGAEEAVRVAMAAPAARIEQINNSIGNLGSGAGAGKIGEAQIDALTAELRVLNAQFSNLKENASEIPVQQIALRLREELGRALIARNPCRHVTMVGTETTGSQVMPAVPKF